MLKKTDEQERGERQDERCGTEDVRNGLHKINGGMMSIKIRLLFYVKLLINEWRAGIKEDNNRDAISKRVRKCKCRKEIEEMRQHENKEIKREKTHIVILVIYCNLERIIASKAARRDYFN